MLGHRRCSGAVVGGGAMARKHEGKGERARSIPGGARRQDEDDGEVEDGADVAGARGLVAGDPPVAGSSVDQAPLEFLCQKKSHLGQGGARNHGEEDGGGLGSCGSITSPESSEHSGGYRGSGEQILQPWGTDQAGE